jgi:hypothetical protein
MLPCDTWNFSSIRYLQLPQQGALAASAIRPMRSHNTTCATQLSLTFGHVGHSRTNQPAKVSFHERTTSAAVLQETPPADPISIMMMTLIEGNMTTSKQSTLPGAWHTCAKALPHSYSSSHCNQDVLS